MTVAEVVSTSQGIEYSVHECPRKHWREVQSVFPKIDPAGLLIVPTCQHAKVDLVRTGERIEEEKDRLLVKFMDFASRVTVKLISKGYWADFIDPCSGLPMVNRDCQTPYGEVEALTTLLGWKTQNAGCCKVVLHPRWGSAVYPASIFAKAPVAEVHAAIRGVNRELQQSQD